MYISKRVKNAVLVILDAVNAMETAKSSRTLFNNFDLCTKILTKEINPYTNNKKYCIDRVNAVYNYQRLLKRRISILQKLLITNPSDVPINQVLIVLALKLQEVLVEWEVDMDRRQVIIDDIAKELILRCKGLEEELIKMDAELMETGQVEVFAL